MDALDRLLADAAPVCLTRLDLSKQSNDYEIVDFMVDRFKRVTGLGTRKKKTTAAPTVHLSEFDPVDYIEGATCTIVS